MEKVTISITKVNSKTGEITTFERDSPFSYDDTINVINDLGDDDNYLSVYNFPKEFKIFSVIYDKFFKKIINNYRDLSRLSLVVLFYLIITADYNKNATKCNQNTIAKELGVAPSKVSVALNQLYQNDFCCKNRILQGGYKFIINPMYIRKASQNKLKSLQVIYNKSYDVVNKTKEKGTDFSEKSIPLDNNAYDKIRESIKRSIKFGKSGAQVRLLNYLLDQFRENFVVNKTVNEISFKTKTNRLSVLKFLKLLEENKFITRERGKIELKVSYQQFVDISLGL